MHGSRQQMLEPEKYCGTANCSVQEHHSSQYIAHVIVNPLFLTHGDSEVIEGNLPRELGS